MAAKARYHSRKRVKRLDRRHPLNLERAQLLDHAALSWREKTHLHHGAAALRAVRQPCEAGIIEFTPFQIIENLASARDDRGRQSRQPRDFDTVAAARWSLDH